MKSWHHVRRLFQNEANLRLASRDIYRHNAAKVRAAALATCLSLAVASVVNQPVCSSIHGETDKEEVAQATESPFVVLYFRPT